MTSSNNNSDSTKPSETRIYNFYRQFDNYGTAAEEEYKIEDAVIYGQNVKVKVYPSSADKIIKKMREKNEAAPTIKGKK